MGETSVHTPRTRANSSDVLKEIRALREDVVALTKLLIGSPDNPNTPGLVERIRSLETSERSIKWVGGLVMIVLIGDIVTRFIGWYRGGP